MKLYELAQDYKALMNAIDNEEIPEEALIDTIESITAGIEEKADNIACILKNLAADCEAIRAEEKRLAERRKQKEKAYDRLKEYLSDSLLNLGMTKMETARNKISFRKSESVEIPDEVVFRDWALINNISFLTYDLPKINKTEIKKALKNGEVIEGAALVTSQNIQIK